MQRGENYFERIGGHFQKNIYQRGKGAIRLAVLQRDLTALLEVPGKRLLDVGGGAGQMALWCAQQGHQVTIVDPSASLLTQAQNAAKAAGYATQIETACGDGLQLHSLLQGEQYDGVLCHAVLEWVEDAEKLLDQCVAMLCPGGFFSLMFYNRLALNFIQHIYGNFDYIERDYQIKGKAKLTPDWPRDPATVSQWLDARGLLRKRLSGIRCFYDYMKPRDRERHFLETLIERELQLSQEAVYLPVARYVHELRICG